MYQVIDKRTGAIKFRYVSFGRACRQATRLDVAYGEARYVVRRSA